MNERNVVFGRVPFVVWALAVIIGIVEVSSQALSLPFINTFAPYVGRVETYALLGFDPVGFRLQLQMMQILQETNVYMGGAPLTLVTYPFVHLGGMSSLFSIVFVLCLGSLLSQLVHQWAALAAFVVSGIAGGLAYLLFPEPAIFLLGAAPAYLGMLGLLAGLLVMEYGKENPLITPAFVGFPPLLFGIKIVQDVIFGPPGYYAANIAGFLCGLLLSLLAARGSIYLAQAGLKRLFQD